MNTTGKYLLIFFSLIILALVFFIKKDANLVKIAPQPTPTPATQNDSSEIVSTKPDPLDGALVAGSDPFEITFSQPLENAPELKNRIEPKLEYKVELSQDRKTAKFIPQKPYELGITYTVFVEPDSKFDGGKRLDKEHIFHIHTIRYRGV